MKLLLLGAGIRTPLLIHGPIRRQEALGLTVTNQSEMRVLPVGIALLQGQHFANNAVLLAAANMATFPLLIGFLFFQKQLVEGAALSGLK
jgi:ABC-type glycerol-3-phosphate transport system permease component